MLTPKGFKESRSSRLDKQSGLQVLKSPGYTILEADSLDAATQLARGCPLLQSGRQITVLDTFSAM